MLSADLLRGEVGPAGAPGTPGADGAPGADGSLRIYGDGSAGERIISTTTTFNDTNPQYTNVTIASGVTLTIPSGTVIRCTGTFTNNGSIQILPALRSHPRFAEDGARVEGLSSGGVEAPGGTGGSALPEVVARSLIRLGLSGGGMGYLENGETGSSGGGNITVLCRQAVINNGSIEAPGSDAATLARGGGGGGFILLASQTMASNTGSLSATGGNGAPLSATDTGGRGQGPGGGGGGGIVHLIAPNVSNAGTIDVSGGSGGAAGNAGAITGFVYLGGGGGGGSGGAGGNGGSVNPGGIGNDSTGPGVAGTDGLALITPLDPTTLF